jgi:hypothetical protein
MNTAWAEETTARAQAHWTPARLETLTQGKTLAFLPVEAAPLLRALGLLNADGSLPPTKAAKYFQINHMVAVLGPSLRELMAAERPIRIVDAACGRSYLTLLLAWGFRHRWGHAVEILGLERNPDLVEESRRRAALVGLDDILRFEVADLSEIDSSRAILQRFGAAPVDAVVALHACDIATDCALRMGLELEATLIAVAPCCHAELAKQWEAIARDEAAPPGAFAPLQRSPHLRREAGATLTDALRGLLLTAAGYGVSTLEFVPSEHTPKNTLLRAMRRRALDLGAWREYLALRDAIGSSGIHLERSVATLINRA